MKIPLPELGLDCEKKECTASHANECLDCEYCHSCIRSEEYNERLQENEKSVLVIDEDKLAMQIFIKKIQNYNLDMYTEALIMDDCYSEAKHLSQNARQFMRIEKEK